MHPNAAAARVITEQLATCPFDGGPGAGGGRSTPMNTTTQTVEIEWTEVSHHRAMVNVAPGLDLDCVDLGDELAVRAVEHDAALRFDPV